MIGAERSLVTVFLRRMCANGLILQREKIELNNCNCIGISNERVVMRNVVPCNRPPEYQLMEKQRKEEAQEGKSHCIL